MTFSIVARDGDQLGVAVASKFLAVGAFVPAATAGVGAIASQSFVNLRYVPDGFALLADGVPAPESVARLTAADEQRESRQLGIVDAEGRSGTFTGTTCIDWAGGSCGPGYAAQGNCLAGPEVVDAMEKTFLATQGPLSVRLLTALRAGDDAGGDRRGRQSAALYVVSPGGGYEGGSDVLVDLRVDDSPTPVAELTRLLGLHDLYFGTADPDTLLPLSGETGEEVRGLLAALGRTGEDLDAVLFAWMGWENYEERHVPGSIDPVVLAALRQAS
ncbi:MAG: fimbrial assembly protein FimA [Frankiales bacterium]|nr:fimbrial assembly protein FimA [Frankiales bacterium]